MSEEPTVTRQWNSVVNYSAGLELQELAQANVKNAAAPQVILLGLEHEPVITLGKRGRVEADTRTTDTELSEKGIQLSHSARGGQATLHSPGQLVIYPIVPIKKLGISVRDYVQLLETVSLGWLRRLGVDARKGLAEPGIYTSSGKLIFFGIRVRNGVTSHGIAINVRNDLSLFKLIRSCGVDQERFARLTDLGVDLPLAELFASWASAFEEGLKRFLVRSLDS